MLSIHVKRDTTVSPELVLDTLRDPSPERRGEIWSNITPKRFRLHDSGPDFIDVTEGTFIVGVFWERSRYEWPQPGRLSATVSDSNVFKPGSTFELRAVPSDAGGSEVELILRRQYQRSPKGWAAATINHLGGRRLFGWYLGSALKALEKRNAASHA
jgi:hypothetical protein